MELQVFKVAPGRKYDKDRRIPEGSERSEGKESANAVFRGLLQIIVCSPHQAEYGETIEKLTRIWRDYGEGTKAGQQNSNIGVQAHIH